MMNRIKILLSVIIVSVIINMTPVYSSPFMKVGLPGFKYVQVQLPEEGLSDVERYYLTAVQEFASSCYVYNYEGISWLSTYRGFDARYERLAKFSQGRSFGSPRLNFDFEYQPVPSVDMDYGGYYLPTSVSIYAGGTIIRLHNFPSCWGTIEYQPGYRTTNALYFDFHENGMLKTLTYWRNIYPESLSLIYPETRDPQMDPFKSFHKEVKADLLETINKRLVPHLLEARSETPYPATEYVRKYAIWGEDGKNWIERKLPDPDPRDIAFLRDPATGALPEVTSLPKIENPLEREHAKESELELADYFTNIWLINQFPENGLSDDERHKLNLINRFLQDLTTVEDLPYMLASLSKIHFDELFNAPSNWNGIKRSLRVGIKFRENFSGKEVCSFKYETDLGMIVVTRSLDKKMIETLNSDARTGLTFILDKDNHIVEMFSHQRDENFFDSLKFSADDLPEGYAVEDVETANEFVDFISKDPSIRDARKRFSDLHGQVNDVVKHVIWDEKGEQVVQEDHYEKPFSGQFPGAAF